MTAGNWWLIQTTLVPAYRTIFQKYPYVHWHTMPMEGCIHPTDCLVHAIMLAIFFHVTGFHDLPLQAWFIIMYNFCNILHFTSFWEDPVQFIIYHNVMSLHLRKSHNLTWNNWATSWENLSSEFSNQIWLKLACSASEGSCSLEISDIATSDTIVSRQQTMKAMIRLCECADWSTPLLFACGIRQVFSWCGSVMEKQCQLNINLLNCCVHFIISVIHFLLLSICTCMLNMW